MIDPEATIKIYHSVRKKKVKKRKKENKRNDNITGKMGSKIPYWPRKATKNDIDQFHNMAIW